jgi:predicted ATPase with chaperone activity
MVLFLELPGTGKTQVSIVMPALMPRGRCSSSVELASAATIVQSWLSIAELFS